MKLYGLPKGQDLDHWNDIAKAEGNGHIILVYENEYSMQNTLSVIIILPTQI